MLQLDVVLVAWASRAGLLQDHASDPRSFCAARLCERRFLLFRCTGRGACGWQISRPRFPRPCDYGAVSCAANPLHSSPTATSHLVHPRVVPRLEALVCFGIPVSTGGSICENAKYIFCWAICGCIPSGPPAALRCASKGAGPCPRNSPAPVPRRRTHFLQFHFHDSKSHAWNPGRHSCNSPSYLFA